jgi:hypothetical protein
MLLGMRRQALIGCAAVVAFLLYFVGSSASDHRPPHFDIQDDNHGLVHLADGADTTVDEGSSTLRKRSEDTGATVMASRSSSLGQSSEDGKAYQDAVESYAQHYSDIIGRANPLVHEMFVHSEGTEQMTKADIEKLADLLSEMKDAPDSEVIGSYPKGYEDCDGYLREGATSLSLAADSVGEFNETADMEYLRDYRRLTAMYMQAVADVQWCVSDHLHQAYP